MDSAEGGGAAGGGAGGGAAVAGACGVANYLGGGTMSIAGDAFKRYASACPYRLDFPVVRRPANALNVELIQPMRRCKRRPPNDWPVDTAVDYAFRWIVSGGDPLVFGYCCAAYCPLKPNFCESCGRMATTHMTINGRTWPYDCGKK